MAVVDAFLSAVNATKLRWIQTKDRA